MTAVFNDAALKLRKKETKPTDQALTDSFNFSERFKILVVEIYWPCIAEGLYKVSELNLSSLTNEWSIRRRQKAKAKLP